MVCMHLIYVLILCMHPIMVHVYMIMQYCKLQYACNLLKNLKVTALLENGMYYIPVYGMYASYICIDTMYASYYGACIYDYCNIANFSMHAIYLKNLKVTALLENGMYYIPVCGMYASYMHLIYYVCILLCK